MFGDRFYNIDYISFISFNLLCYCGCVVMAVSWRYSTVTLQHSGVIVALQYSGVIVALQYSGVIVALQYSGLIVALQYCGVKVTLQYSDVTA